MNNLYDVLEICLQELEKGADLESVLARYPHLAAELHPILKASITARKRSSAMSAPSPDVMRRGRAKFLQRASEMREAKAAPRKRMIPLFQRLAISFTMTALFLASGTGLVGASSSALPGENLYPVKLTWESVRLFFTFDDKSRELLEYSFENERLHEINELLVEGRHETIQFAGVFMELNNQTYVSGIRIVILDTSVLPVEKLLNGTEVIVIGRTNAEGFIDVESIKLLPAGAIVPTGEPIEAESSHDQNDGAGGNDSGSGGSHFNENINDSGDGNENTDDTNINENDNGNDSNDNGSDDGNDNVNDDNNDNNNDNSNDNNNDNNNDGNSNDDNSNDDNSNDDNSNDNSSDG